LLHLSGNLGCQDQARLFGALDRALDGVGAELVGGPTLVDPGVLGEAVQDVQNDNSEIVESAETVSGFKRLAIFEPFDLKHENTSKSKPAVSIDRLFGSVAVKFQLCWRCFCGSLFKMAKNERSLYLMHLLPRHFGFIHLIEDSCYR
jgi:hypothetical protein